VTQLEKDRTTSQIGKVVYTAKTHTTGGRENGASRSSDGRLDVRLSTPGSARIGTNPEQLFAAGWSACFGNAIALAARQKKITLPADVAIDAEVDLGTAHGAYGLAARLNVSLPGMERQAAQALVRPRTRRARFPAPRAATSTSQSTFSSQCWMNAMLLRGTALCHRF
jgi:osmotically inducible protein OsmC